MFYRDRGRSFGEREDRLEESIGRQGGQGGAVPATQAGRDGGSEAEEEHGQGRGRKMHNNPADKYYVPILKMRKVNSALNDSQDSSNKRWSRHENSGLSDSKVMPLYCSKADASQRQKQ